VSPRGLTPPSSGRATAGFACRVTPLMSNVRPLMTSISKRPKHPIKGGWRDVLVFAPKKADQGKVRRHYLRWREEHGIPLRCDEPTCHFHTGQLEWNGRRLNLILDHKEGNRYDNSPASLRLLCPNCDSQLPTRGGGNRGRVRRVVEGGYTLGNKDGSIIEAATGVPAKGQAKVAAVGSVVRSSPSAAGV